MNNAIARLLTLRVADMMRRDVAALAPEQSMADAANRLSMHEISGGPVVDASGACVGVLSAGDFVRREIRGTTHGEPAHSLTGVLADRLGQPSVGNGENDDRVSNYMTRGVRWVNAKDSLIDAAELMCEGHVHRLLVLDKDEHVVGIISSLDIVSAVVGVVEEHCSATRP